MAIGPTEGLFGNFFQMSPSQVQVSDEMASIMQNAMRGVTTMKNNPDAAIPPANAPQKVNTAGIGGQLDLTA